MVAWTFSASGANCISSKARAMKSALARELKVGDTRARAEEVLRAEGLVFAYDQYQKRYQSTVTSADCGPYQAVSVYVNLDSEEKVSKIEVLETFTSP